MSQDKRGFSAPCDHAVLAVELGRISSELAMISSSLGNQADEARALGGNNLTVQAERISQPPGDESPARRSRPPLPDPRLVRQVLRQRRMRDRYFGAELFGDPAWDMLLDLAAARAEHKHTSVTSLCIASGVPTTTALRWVGQLTEAGLVSRQQDDTDRRRAFLVLTDKAVGALARYFADVRTDWQNSV
jgi:hypothetical protein